MRIRTLLAGRSERYKVREMEEKPTRNAKLRDKSKKSAIETPVLSSSLLSSSSLEYAAFVRRFCVTFIQKKEKRFEFFNANTLNS